jgi:hypothetical protein
MPLLLLVLCLKSYKNIKVIRNSLAASNYGTFGKPKQIEEPHEETVRDICHRDV